MATDRQSDAARAYLEYFRDMGVYDFYRNGEPSEEVLAELAAQPAQPAAKASQALVRPAARPQPIETERIAPVIAPVIARPVAAPPASAPPRPEVLISKPLPLQEILPVAPLRIAAAERPAALTAIQNEIGDCTRCPLAYAGRRKIVFGDGDPSARLMFVGEGPGADEDTSGIPFVGKAGQLLNNMIAAMGLKREPVYIANIVKCRPHANRVPETAEANTCAPFLARQIDVVKPEVIVALGATAATYMLGVRQSLASLRGQWFESRGAKVIVTYHPAFLLRDPRQKGEAWKDLQTVMAEMGLKSARKE